MRMKAPDGWIRGNGRVKPADALPERLDNHILKLAAGTETGEWRHGKQKLGGVA